MDGITKLLGRRLRRWMIVLGACSGIFVGVAVAYYVRLPDARWIWLLVPFAVFSLRRHNVLTLLLLTLLCFGIGWWKGSLYSSQLALYQDLYGKNVTLIARASEEAVYGNQYQLTFTVDSVRAIAPVDMALKGTLTVAGFGAPAIYRGDIVQIEGKLKPTLGNSVGRMSYAHLTVLENRSTPVDELRRMFAAGMQSALPEPMASFGLGILIGLRATLPENVQDNLRKAGLTHIIAVSGYNLTIIVQVVRKLTQKRSKFQATMWCLLLIALFLLVTGNSPSIVRAGIISVIGIAAWYYGRAIKPMVLLMTAGAITLLANPSYLWGNVSWYLSFLAFYGVLVLSPMLTKRLFGNKEPNIILGVIIESGCAGIMTIPYILFIFGQISLVSLLANVVIVPLVPLAMLLSLIGGLAGMLLPAFAGWFAWPAMLILTLILDIANLVAKVPHAFVENIGFPLIALGISYGAILFVAGVMHRRTRRQKSAIITDDTS